MAKSIKQWMGRPLYVYLFGFFYVANKTAQCFPSFNFTTALLFLGAYCLITFILSFLFKRTLLQKGANLFILLLWIIVLFFSEIYGWLFESIHFELKIRYLIIGCVISLLSIFFAQRRIPGTIIISFHKVINSFLFILITITLISGLLLFRKETKHELAFQQHTIDLNNSGGKKDIIWILLDEYGAPASLQRELKFDDFLVDSLKDRGFLVYDSMLSRSDMTLFSINSIFNPDDTILPPNFTYAGKYLQQSRWIQQLESMGYTFNNLDFLNISHYKGFERFGIFPYSYTDQLLNGTLLSALDNRSFYSDAFFDPYNQQVIQQLSEQVKEDSDHAQFTWAHLLIPHIPFCRDANGEPVKEKIDYTHSSREKIIKAYVDYVAYGNKVVLKILNQIPGIKDKTIIISGDHGFRFRFLADDNPVRKATFCAVYYPGMDTIRLKKMQYIQQIPFYLPY